MSNKQYDAVLDLAHEKHIDLSACPTCRQHKFERAPGIWQWPPSTYRLYDADNPCDCKWQDNLQRHYLLANIPKDYWTLSEDDFFGDPKALEATLDYLDAWENWKWHGMGVAFHSKTLGTGKTMLATIIGRHLIQQGERVFFTPFRDILHLWDIPYELRDEKVRRLRNTTVLILDEVVTAISDAQSGYFATELEDLIRFRTSGNAVTIITTNMTTEELGAQYPRTFSLLASKQRHISVAGMDARRSGDLDLLRDELIRNHEAKPIV